MTPEQQQLVLSLVADFIVAMPIARWNRCDGLAALRLSCVARNQQRHRLTSWGWRQLCRCEQSSVRLLDTRQQRVNDWLDNVSTLLRSNTNAVQGSLLSRLRTVISAAAILEGIERNARSVRTPAVIREWIAAQVNLGHFWFGVENLSDDQAEAVAGEYMYSDSSDDEV